SGRLRAGKIEGGGSRGKQSALSLVPSSSVSARNGSVPRSRSLMFETPSPSISDFVALKPALYSALSLMPSPFVSALPGSVPITSSAQASSPSSSLSVKSQLLSTRVKPLMAVGGRWDVVVPSPSCPDPFGPHVQTVPSI